VGWTMKVYEHKDPDSLIPRSHPWIDGESDPAHRYYDFRTSPELIRSTIEDMQEWSTYPATETFYRLLEWLNGSESVFESNDCAFSGAIANTSAQSSKRLQCSGRLMILYRDLALNTSPEQIHWLTNAAAHALRRTDPGFEWGAIGATIMPVRFTTLPGPPELQRGQQLMLSFWAWGENELEVMTNLDRTFRNVTVALRKLSDEIRHSSPAITSDD
ncbi:MAG: hypothetical protein NTZ28_00430, partial [Nitrospirae bacterium]|nr:hypothetical protein [Nitrospirota bacterium]